MKVGEHFLPCAITVLEKEQDMDFIFGLDMLRRHACSIDLRKNALVIGSVDVELPFLSESEIGKTAQEAFQGKAPEAAIPTPSAAVATPLGGGPDALDDAFVFVGARRRKNCSIDRARLFSAASYRRLERDEW